MARMLLFTDREVVALGIGRVVHPSHELETMGLGRLAQELPIGASEARTRVLILDAPPEASHLIPLVCSLNSAAPVVVWVRGTCSEPALGALGLGARAVLLDTSSAEEIQVCIETVLRGGVWVPQSVSQAVVAHRMCKVTARQGQLMRLVSRGMNNKEIADKLNISIGTVKMYLSTLFNRLEVSDRFELALLGLRQGGSVYAGPTLGSPPHGTAADEVRPRPRPVFIPRVRGCRQADVRIVIDSAADNPAKQMDFRAANGPGSLGVTPDRHNIPNGSVEKTGGYL
jgi:NarL family two-component system response regulator LiaR